MGFVYRKLESSLTLDFPEHKSRKPRDMVKDFIVKALEESAVSGDHDFLLADSRSLCPVVGCGCRPRRINGKASRLSREITFLANATGPPPLEDEWIFV